MTKELTPQECVKEARHVTWVGFWCNAALGAAKIVAGVFASSSALIADGIHSFSDFVSDVIVLAMVGIARKKPDRKHVYGHGKYETLATILLSLVLFAVALGILWDGVGKVIDFARGEEIPRPGVWALIICVASIVVKEWLYRYTRRVGRRITSEVVVANAWHHRSDSFSSIATLAGVAGTMFLGKAGGICDPAAAIIVSIFIIAVSVKMAVPALHELLEISLPEHELRSISEAIASTSGVKAFHHLRTRRSGADVIVDMHIKVDPGITVEEAHNIATEVEDKVRDLYCKGTPIVTVHVEPYRGESVRSDGSC